MAEEQTEPQSEPLFPINVDQLNSTLTEIVQSVQEFQRVRVRGLAAIKRAMLLGILQQTEQGLACIKLPSNLIRSGNTHLTPERLAAVANVLLASNAQLEADGFAGEAAIAAVIP